MTSELRASGSSERIRTLNTGGVHFGFGLDPLADTCLQKAATLVSSTEQSLGALNEARDAAPDQLDVLLALYKLHFYRGDIRVAEEYVRQTLVKAAIQGGFSHRWEELSAHSANWASLRGPSRIYLCSLKALAFVCLRQHRLVESESVLAVLERLDPDDRVGAGVIRDLLTGMQEEDDG
ncbi:MAG: hypothetical protein AB2807_02290 [Candidatus Sedimenticola endophacoides]